MNVKILIFVALFLAATASVSYAQEASMSMDHQSMNHGSTVKTSTADMSMSDTGMKMEGEHPMNGMLGPYPMTREASGTSWQPESSPHNGIDFINGDWMG